MENFEHKMRRLLDYYIRITGTRDPLEIAKSIGIGIAIFPLGNIAGNYKLLKRKRQSVTKTCGRKSREVDIDASIDFFSVCLKQSNRNRR